MSDLATIAAFTQARLAEDREIANGLLFACKTDDMPDFTGRGGPCAEDFWKRFDPHRMLADVEAKRRIIAACTRAAEAAPDSPAAALALAILEAMSTEWEHPDRPFVPDWTIRPGILLRRSLEWQGRSAADLPDGQGLLDGTLRIDARHAAQIADLLGTSAEMWLNAQRLHDAAILRGATDTSDEHVHD